MVLHQDEGESAEFPPWVRPAETRNTSKSRLNIPLPVCSELRHFE